MCHSAGMVSSHPLSSEGASWNRLPASSYVRVAAVRFCCAAPVIVVNAIACRAARPSLVVTPYAPLPNATKQPAKVVFIMPPAPGVIAPAVKM